VHQMVFFTCQHRRGETHTQRTKRRIDREAGRRLYGHRIGTVEPVFGNIRYNKKINRLTLSFN